MKSSPLESYSSLHEISLIKLLGLKSNWPIARFFFQYSCNVHQPLMLHPQAHLTLHTANAQSPPSHTSFCFSINNLTRWQLDISSYKSVEEYIDSSIREHRRNYSKSKKNFLNYGCEISLIESDWQLHAESVYRLYSNVARRYGRHLYTLKFFQEISQRQDCKLLCAWYKEEMIAVFVLQEELPTLHSICCGLDYNHSSASYAYSWMHYALLDQAIQLQKYQIVDVGVAGDQAKKSIGFKPVDSRMDIYCKGRVTKGLLRLFTRFFTASITAEQKLKIKLR